MSKYVFVGGICGLCEGDAYFNSPIPGILIRILDHGLNGKEIEYPPEACGVCKRFASNEDAIRALLAVDKGMVL